MDAVHLMRAITGRDLIVKIEGSYHGHHDAVMVSMYSDLDELGPRERPRSRGRRPGIPQAMADLVRRRAVQRPRRARARCSTEHAGRVAGMIMEPMMMNAGIVPPAAGLPRGRAASSPATTACCWPSTRSRPGSRSVPAGPPRCSACSPTSCAWPRRWAAACRAAPSAARPR